MPLILSKDHSEKERGCHKLFPPLVHPQHLIHLYNYYVNEMQLGG